MIVDIYINNFNSISYVISFKWATHRVVNYFTQLQEGAEGPEKGLGNWKYAHEVKSKLKRSKHLAINRFCQFDWNLRSKPGIAILIFRMASRIDLKLSSFHILTVLSFRLLLRQQLRWLEGDYARPFLYLRRFNNVVSMELVGFYKHKRERKRQIVKFTN